MLALHNAVEDVIEVVRGRRKRFRSLSGGRGWRSGGCGRCVEGFKAGCAGEDGESCAVAENTHHNKRRTTVYPERTIRIKTFWESITLIGK